MSKSDQFTRIASQRAHEEARRRAAAVMRVTVIVVMSVLATLVFSGHRLSPECVRAFICIEQSGG